MRKEFSLLLLILLVASVGVVSAGDEDKINAGLQANKGGTYIIPAGTYDISGQIIVPENTNMKGTVSESGEIKTKFILGRSFYLGKSIPIILLKGHNDISYISIDGNAANRDGAPSWKGIDGKQSSKKTGYGSDNFFGCNRVSNIRIHHCIMQNSLGDGFRPYNSQYLEFDHNVIENLGHDACFPCRCEFVSAHDNKVQIRVNSAFRAMDGYSIRFYDNLITCGEEYSGPGIQLQNDEGRMGDIEVCGNVIIGSCGPAFWIVGKTASHEQSAYIHHNLILNSGWNRGIEWVGGAICSGYSNLVFENNVFEGNYKSGVGFFLRVASWEDSGEVTLEKNIIIDSVKGNSDKKGGWGIWNNIGSQQKIYSYENCYYGNIAGDFKGTITESRGDVFVNPKTSATPSDWRWNGEEWECDGYEMAPITGKIDGVEYGESVYDGLPEVTDSDIEAFEFTNIFSILDVGYYSGFSIPSRMPSKYKSPTVCNMTVYNNTYMPQTRYYVETDNFTSKVVYEYNNTTSCHFLQTKFRIQGITGYDNIDMWQIDGGASRLGELFVIPEAAGEGQNPVKITVYDIAGRATEIKTYEREDYNENLTHAINPILIPIAAIFIIIVVCISINLRVIVGKWRLLR